MKKYLLIITTLDTKGREAEYIRESARSLGVQPVLMDTGTLGRPLADPDITSRDVASAAGDDLERIIAKKDRAGAVAAMQKGGAILAKRLFDEGRLQGVFGMGGGTGTAIVTSIMRSLPFGLPKVVVSTVSSRDVREYVGTKDIVMFHSVADILGSNEFIRHILAQAAHAACGMINAGTAVKQGKPMVGVTAYGVNSACALNAEPLLEEKGYEMIGFHANGVGGMAMEEMVGQGLLVGVLDFTPHELADEMYGGYCRGIGEKRFEMAGEMGVPLVLAPGGLDNAVFSPYYPMPETLKGRRIHSHDTRFCVRMEKEEMVKFAEIIGEKLNRSRGPAHVLIPERGWSEADKPGKELFDPDTDRVFVGRLKRVLRPDVPVEEMDAHISDEAFAVRAVDILDGMIKRLDKKPSKR
ncbi:MAG TPA: Tm-1-like ATP-binding domain-containing protein [Syntrophorhabdaceae bacterium]|nr:Tm-1-like ATP-binding domain-containing protein [Syntrophorhabdaceae bacterium]HQM82551.1 Tm-1-like ATP-binding domain-containing protein [Syntrophorhabdaceae bacterium]